MIHTRPLKSIPVFRPGLWAEIMLSLLRLERKQKNSSNPFGICIFLFLSYSFGIETINTFIHSVVPSKTIPDSRPKWAKCVPVFRPKRRKNPTRWGGTYLCSKRECPSLPSSLFDYHLCLIRLPLQGARRKPHSLNKTPSPSQKYGENDHKRGHYKRLVPRHLF